MRDWVVAADDRTGAFEVAALFAASAGPVTVTVGRPVDGPCVVDLGSRGLDAAVASAAAAAIEYAPSGWSAHKMDSTLRGNWVAEVRARQARRGGRVVVLPGWPALGRTCVDGVVHVHGSPIGSVLDHLPEASLVRTVAALGEWLAGGASVAVCDVPDSAAMQAMASVVAGVEGVLIVGPAGPLGAAFAARCEVTTPVPTPPLDDAVLVVCGSANPVSRSQVERLAVACPDVTILTAPDAEGPLHVGVANELAASSHEVASRLRPATIVLLGGDTAAAYLGDAPRLVGGTVAAGMPWSRDADGGGPLVITKAGGFGGPDALVMLFSPRGA
ncbi:MAG: four-carbon acid sugar kinase family protein [Ilumatobacteraceae bacterium]